MIDKIKIECSFDDELKFSTSNNLSNKITFEFGIYEKTIILYTTNIQYNFKNDLFNSYMKDNSFKNVQVMFGHNVILDSLDLDNNFDEIKQEPQKFFDNKIAPRIKLHQKNFIQNEINEEILLKIQKQFK